MNIVSILDVPSVLFVLQGRLFPERIQCLDGIGFVWNVQAYKWRRYMEAIVEFYEENRHTRVPMGWKKCPSLHVWLNKVQNLSRTEFRDAPFVNDDDVALLRKMGAIRQHRSNWQQQYDDIVELQSTMVEHGDCSLDEVHKARLTNWCRMQRYLYRHGYLSHEKICLLERVGFNWNDGDPSWLTKRLG